MADQDRQQQQQQQQQALSAFPAPPPFYKHFTPDNLLRVKELQDSGQDIPPELRPLLPPAPPEEGTYHSFGDPYHITEVLPSLKDSSIEQLYPSPPSPGTANDSTTPAINSNRALHLRRIAQSLLLNFMELVGVLAIDPAAYEGKIADLRTLFLNAHHLLNEYRPHQARESLALMMEDQLEQCRAETEAIREAKEKVEKVLEGLREDVEREEMRGKVRREKEREDEEGGRGGRGREDEELRVWTTLETELGGD